LGTHPDRIAAALNAELAEALRLGDLEAARVAHEALGRFLQGGAESREVVDLAAERVKRAQT
jgi:hypothetical protein